MRYVFSLLLILVSVQAYGLSTAIQAVVSAGGAAPSFCSSCTGTSDADILCEGFENTDCSGWADTDGGASCTIDRSGTSSGITGCTDEGTKAAIYTRGFAYQDCFSTSTFSDLSTVKLIAYINIKSLTWNADTTLILMRMSNIAGPSTTAWTLYAKKSGVSDIILELGYYNGTGYDTYGTTNTITRDTYYPIQIEWVSGTSIVFGVDWDNNGTFTEELNDSTTIGTRTVRYFIPGTISANADILTLEIDNIKMDDDTTPTGCAR